MGPIGKYVLCLKELIVMINLIDGGGETLDLKDDGGQILEIELFDDGMDGDWFD